MTRGARVGTGGVLVGLALLTSACGVPTGGGPERIPASAVPFGLASPTTSGSPVPSPPAAADQPRIFLVASDDALLPIGRDVPGATVRERLAVLLADLAAGPTGRERDDHLATDLPPGVTLTVDDIQGTTATIAIAGSADAPSGRQSRAAVAQIVLTATSLPGIDSVLLTRGGTAVDAPLPSGKLTDAPLTAADYASLLTAPSSPPS